jgi:Fur family ferric uptake transcriptional regulator
VERARRRLRDAGQRSTEHRAQVLAALTAAARPMSHHELEARLAPIDKVTLYRVLDWLVAQRVAHRVAGSDRVWRFAASEAAHTGHAHFECRRCRKVTCLGELPGQPALALPHGYRLEDFELTAKGRCARCA